MKYEMGILVTLLCVSVATRGAASDAFSTPLTKRNEAAFSRVIASLAVTSEIVVTFSQEKQMKVLPAPLRSSGFMAISPKRVCWHTAKPVSSTLRLTPEGMTHFTADGSAAFRGATESRETAYLVRMMMALFLADRAILEGEFRVYFQESKDGWTIGLRPTRRQVTRVLSGVVLQGDRQMRRVILLDAGGDVTRIDLEAVPSGRISLEACAP